MPSPLRSALLRRILTEGRASAEDLVADTGCLLCACRRYLAELLGQRILSPDDSGAVPGPLYAAWSSARPRTHAGGHSRAYLAARARREQERRERWVASLSEQTREALHVAC
jgi:hypothetical protein